MSTPYQGQSANITTPGTVNIASSTNATPIVVTTSAPHGILDGTEVDVQNHQTNLNANGINRIGYISSTQFSLLGTVGTAVGGASGTVQSLAPPQYTLVDGSVPPVSGAFNTPTEFNADTAAMLWLSTGSYKIVNRAEDGITQDNLTAWDYFTITAINTWTPSNGNAAFTLPGRLNSGDILIVEFDVNLNFACTGDGSSTFVQVALFASLFAPGVAPPARVRINNSSRHATCLSALAGTNETCQSMHLSGSIVSGTGAWPTGNSIGFNIYPQVRTADLAAFGTPSIGGLGTVVMFSDYMARYIQLRPTGIPQ
jgi:hypothetical protein